MTMRGEIPVGGRVVSFSIYYEGVVPGYWEFMPDSASGQPLVSERLIISATVHCCCNTGSYLCKRLKHFSYHQTLGTLTGTMPRKIAYKIAKHRG